MSFASPEVELFITRIRRECDRILTALDGFDAEALNWKPVAGANSLAVLATHMPANLDEVLLGTVIGRPGVRDRDAEFAAVARDLPSLVKGWLTVRAEVLLEFEPRPASLLDEIREHPRRGSITVREILLVAARHAAEHAGQAELTRQLVLAR